MKTERPRYRELLKGTTPTLILAILAERPRHGYGVARAIEERSADALRIGEGSLYPALHSLEKDGLIRGRWETRTAGPARKIYGLTRKGRTALATQADSWRGFVTAVESVLGGRLEPSA